jgi:hypothetical protein
MDGRFWRTAIGIQPCSPGLNLRHEKLRTTLRAARGRNIGMAEHNPQKPAPGSGYREQQDPRGQPGQHQKKDGRQLPEEADPDEPKPKEPEDTP